MRTNLQTFLSAISALYVFAVVHDVVVVIVVELRFYHIEQSRDDRSNSL